MVNNMIFHELKVHYERQTGEDNPGKVKEIYLVDGAVSFADAENCLMDAIKPFVFGECDVMSCKRSQFFEVFPNEGGAYWYKARVEMITIDGEKETRKVQSVLVQANLLIRHPFSSSGSIFERISDSHPKSYQICNNCHRITRIKSKDLAAAVESYHPRRFAVSHRILYVYGTCPKCEAARKKALKQLKTS